MSDFIPNRVSAGKSTGGQFAEKVNSEAELDLPSDEVDEHDPNRAYLNYDLDEAFEDDVDDRDPNRAYLNDDLDDDDYEEDDVATTVEKIRNIETPEQWHAMNEKVSKVVPRDFNVSMETLDDGIEEKAELIRAMDHRAIRFVGNENHRDKFDKEYIDGLRDRVHIAPIKENRDALRGVTSNAYDKIEELTVKVEKNPNTPYTAKHRRELDAHWRTAILARVEIRRHQRAEREANQS